MNPHRHPRRSSSGATFSTEPSTAHSIKPTPPSKPAEGRPKMVSQGRCLVGPASAPRRSDLLGIGLGEPFSQHHLAEFDHLQQPGNLAIKTALEQVFEGPVVAVGPGGKVRRTPVVLRQGKIRLEGFSDTGRYPLSDRNTRLTSPTHHLRLRSQHFKTSSAKVQTSLPQAVTLLRQRDIKRRPPFFQGCQNTTLRRVSDGRQRQGYPPFFCRGNEIKVSESSPASRPHPGR